jgi:hypothetical protein
MCAIGKLSKPDAFSGTRTQHAIKANHFGVSKKRTILQDSGFTEKTLQQFLLVTSELYLSDAFEVGASRACHFSRIQPQGGGLMVAQGKPKAQPWVKIQTGNVCHRKVIKK